MKKPATVMLVLAELVSIAYGQDLKRGATAPFTLTWTKGKCRGCKIAAGLGEIQFVSRDEVWGVGSEDHLGGVNTIVVHSSDAGRTWSEVPQSQQYTDPDAQLAFSFLDAARGWISTWTPTGDPKMLSTRDGGQHWPIVSQQFLRRMQFLDDHRGYGTVANKFYRSNDGGHSWEETKIPDVVFIDQLFFLTPELGWIAGSGGKDLLVFRTVNGGTDWEETRTISPRPLELVRDLFFVDPQRGWLTTWNSDGEGASVYSTVDGGRRWTAVPDRLFQGKDKLASIVRFTSRERGFVFVDDGGQAGFVYTTDRGAHWQRQAVPKFVYDCQAFEGDLLCSAAGFRVLRVHPK